MPEIRLENISKSFGGTVAADSLNLTIEDGEYICILGPTGAGKTTCMRIICGLTKADSGKVYFDGTDITDMPVEDREATMLTQVYSLFPRMTVRDNVLFAPDIKGWDPEEGSQLARNMLNMVHLGDRQASYPPQLSGGQQQRVALARALVSGSKVLLLDEPLRALDARLRLELRKELKSLAKSMNMTSVHVTHDQDEALEMADRIAIIRNGRIVQVGTPREVFEDPATPFVANFVGRSNFFEGVIESVDGEVAQIISGGLRMSARNMGFDPGTKVLVAVKVGNTRITRRRPEETVQASAVMGPGRMSEEAPPVVTVEREAYFEGVLARMLYEGATVTAEVEVSGLGIVSCKMPNRKYDTFDIGEIVDVSWIPRSAAVFPYPEGGLEEELRLD
jgi:ABC-type Fe3+/spermidine/putrescine transport system ATPase subunit